VEEFDDGPREDFDDEDDAISTTTGTVKTEPRDD
jgi:hypothetical protein